MSRVVLEDHRRMAADIPSPCVLPGGVITYIGSSGSSPSRTSPESLYSDSSNGSFQSLTQGCPTYFPPSPTGSLTQDPARSFGSIPPSLSDDGSPSSSSSSSSSSSFYNGSPPGSLQVALEDSSRVSPSKSTSSITSEYISGLSGERRVADLGWEFGVHMKVIPRAYPGLGDFS